MCEFIYHYTSAFAVAEILKSGKLWASDLRYSNDATETTYGRNDVLARLETEVERVRTARPAVPAGVTGDTNSDQDARDDPSWWAEHLRTIINNERQRQATAAAFGVCFTELRDALSQWRGYGNAGCAIGVEPPASNGQLALVPDRYGGSDQLTRAFKMNYGEAGKDLVFEQLRALGWATDRTSSQAKDDSDYVVGHRYQATNYLATLKDPGFAEEKEVRLLSTPTGIGGLLSHMARYRTSATGLFIPYLEFEVDRTAIREIWIGPGLHQDQNFDAITAWTQNFNISPDAKNLRKDEYLELKVFRSSTPFR